MLPGQNRRGGSGGREPTPFGAPGDGHQRAERQWGNQRGNGDGWEHRGAGAGRGNAIGRGAWGSAGRPEGHEGRSDNGRYSNGSSAFPSNDYNNTQGYNGNNGSYGGDRTARGHPNGHPFNGSHTATTDHGGHDDFFEQQGQPPATNMTPARLPNGSGLVRKRKFVPPARVGNSANSGGGNSGGGGASRFPGSNSGSGGGKAGGKGGGEGGAGEEELPEELQHLEKAMVDKIVQEIQQRGDPVRGVFGLWSMVYGLWFMVCDGGASGST